MNERQITHYVGDDCEPDGHRTDATWRHVDHVPEQRRVTHQHGTMTHSHFVKIIDGKPEEHDHSPGDADAHPR